MCNNCNILKLFTSRDLNFNCFNNIINIKNLLNKTLFLHFNIDYNIYEIVYNKNIINFIKCFNNFIIDTHCYFNENDIHKIIINNTEIIVSNNDHQIYIDPKCTMINSELYFYWYFDNLNLDINNIFELLNKTCIFLSEKDELKKKLILDQIIDNKFIFIKK
ncbi:hypothetical protein Hokovirus_3_138 [Hokovirus HKV1]|uniref:Uncharacterized protein n=1 Tax=Hokovirus HKV1 TaxID=1977638 RepID=A0A1V0SGM0_9VIRU|nr:hypothetical protein Hokovirus_3_138 [Hokovirus HKV1]